jgi:hypothetical protein
MTVTSRSEVDHSRHSSDRPVSTADSTGHSQMSTRVLRPARLHCSRGRLVARLNRRWRLQGKVAYTRQPIMLFAISHHIRANATEESQKRSLNSVFKLEATHRLCVQCSRPIAAMRTATAGWRSWRRIPHQRHCRFMAHGHPSSSSKSYPSSRSKRGVEIGAGNVKWRESVT